MNLCFCHFATYGLWLLAEFERNQELQHSKKLGIELMKSSWQVQVDIKQLGRPILPKNLKLLKEIMLAFKDQGLEDEVT